MRMNTYHDGRRIRGLHDEVVQRFVRHAHPLNLAGGMKYRGVVPAAKQPLDFL
jgi:hypothetical protein